MKLRIEPEENTLDHAMDFHLMDENGLSVCIAIQSVEQARHIVHCVNNHDRLVDQLREVKEFMEVELTGTAWADCRHMAHGIGKLLTELEPTK